MRKKFGFYVSHFKIMIDILIIFREIFTTFIILPCLESKDSLHIKISDTELLENVIILIREIKMASFLAPPKK